MTKFYNAVGERVRCVILEEGYTRFETSAFTKIQVLAKLKWTSCSL